MLTIGHLSGYQKHCLYSAIHTLHDLGQNVDKTYDIDDCEHEKVIDFYMRHTNLDKETAYEHLKAFVSMPLISYEDVYCMSVPSVGKVVDGHIQITYMKDTYEHHEKAVNFYNVEKISHERVKRIFDLELLHFNGKEDLPKKVSPKYEEILAIKSQYYSPSLEGNEYGIYKANSLYLLHKAAISEYEKALIDFEQNGMSDSYYESKKRQATLYAMIEEAEKEQEEIMSLCRYGTCSHAEWKAIQKRINIMRDELCELQGGK